MKNTLRKGILVGIPSSFGSTSVSTKRRQSPKVRSWQTKTLNIV